MALLGVVTMLGVIETAPPVTLIMLRVPTWSVSSLCSYCQYIRLQSSSTEKANFTLYARAPVSEMAPLRAIS
jgi:hypothetical protein